jgi:Tol biopolymer transport system component
MGEVCRARDTKLGRDVALKVLPDTFAADPDRMARFQREAQLLAALNHPNIAAIYGLEDEGSRRAIVMELVEGQTLTGPIAIDDAIRIARQITEAIEYAHDRGIIHRDLKPANIKVTPDGSVKVLDFGLAKAMDEASDPVMNALATMSPTLSLAATHAGVILGTAAYMAPEQAKGKPADRRSDVWAFGVVLYEMLTGDRMFGGDSVPETLASVMKDEITFGKLPAETPHAVRKLVARCLERDPRRRLQSIGEARIVLEDASAGVVADDAVSTVPIAPVRYSRWPWAIAGVAILALLATLAFAWRRPAAPLPLVTRFAIPPTDGTTLTAQGPNASHLAVSPDGKYVAYVADESGRDRTIWIRALDSLTATRLDRTDGAAFPFWSPDSKDIAYFSGGKLMRVSLASGSPHTICDAPSPEGGTWFQANGQDGEIIFAGTTEGPLQRVLAQGGRPKPITMLAPGETGHSSPQFLPDGQRFLYLARGSKPGIYVQRLGSSDRTFVMESMGRAVFAPPAFLLYLRDSTLFAQHWNLDTLRLEGDPSPIAEGVRNGGTNGRNAFSVSSSSVLTYRGGAGGTFQISAYTREGRRDATLIDAGEYGAFQLSPDGNRLVMVRGTANDRDLWVKELSSGVFSRLTSAPEAERDPVWSPDSRRVAYVGSENGKDRLYQTVIGSGKQTLITNDALAGFNLRDWTPDGTQLVLRRTGTVGVLPVPKEGEAAATAASLKILVNEPYAIEQLRVAPDRKWVAYTSNESGQPEVNIASFPAFGDRRQISTGGAGAVQALWRADGKELFYVTRERKMMAVDATSAGSTLRTGQPHVLFETTLNPNNAVHLYAVSSDGKRFFVRETLSREGSVEPLYVVTNWTSLLR